MSVVFLLMHDLTSTIYQCIFSLYARNTQVRRLRPNSLKTPLQYREEKVFVNFDWTKFENENKTFPLQLLLLKSDQHNAC